MRILSSAKPRSAVRRGRLSRKCPADLPAGFAVDQGERHAACAAAAFRKLSPHAADPGRSVSLAATARPAPRISRLRCSARIFRSRRHEGNFNNHIGLPLTMLRARGGDQVGVIEMGMNHPGEIAPLAALAAPEVGIITNIGIAHIEYMGAAKRSRQEKGMLAEALPPSGTFDPERTRRFL
ncbi:MAG: Mur ligase family protein [Nibricoccus sp.]